MEIQKLDIQTYKDYAKLRKAIGTLQKSGTNPHFKNTYVELNVAIEVIDEHLEAHNFICFLQSPFIKDGENYLRTKLVHTNGDIIDGEIKLITVRQDPQMVGSSLTYMRRYSLITILGLKDKDDDGNAGNGIEKKKKENKKSEVKTYSDDAIEKGFIKCKEEKDIAKVWGLCSPEQKKKFETNKNTLKEKLKKQEGEK